MNLSASNIAAKHESARSADEVLHTPEHEMEPEVATHPFPCNCAKCGMEFCDCSESETGTVVSDREAPEKGE